MVHPLIYSRSDWSRDVRSPVALVDFPEELFTGERAGRVRALPDEAHVAPEHVEQLRRLVDAGAAQHAADTRHAIIVFAGGALPVAIGAIDLHRPQLVDREQLIASSHALLAEQDRAAVLDLYRDGRGRPDRSAYVTGFYLFASAAYWQANGGGSRPSFQIGQVSDFAVYLPLCERFQRVLAPTVFRLTNYLPAARDAFRRGASPAGRAASRARTSVGP